MKSFEELYNLDISSKVKKNKGLDYLNWLDCLMLLRQETGMAIAYDVTDFKELSISGQVIVTVWVKVGAEEHYITYTDCRSRDFEFIKQRGFVKCVAINWGLGLKLWEGENDPAVDDGDLKERIVKAVGNLIGQKFEDNEAAMDFVFAIPVIGEKISAMKGKDRALKFGAFLESGSVEDRKMLLSKLESLTKDEPF
jgi:hypothetical protein